MATFVRHLRPRMPGLISGARQGFIADQELDMQVERATSVLRDTSARLAQANMNTQPSPVTTPKTWLTRRQDARKEQALTETMLKALSSSARSMQSTEFYLLVLT